MHHLKTIETYGEFWKHFETHNWKPLKSMGDFENTLKHILKTLLSTSFENTLKSMGNFENTLKHIIWKHFETCGGILKTLWNT